MVRKSFWRWEEGSGGVLRCDVNSDKGFLSWETEDVASFAKCLRFDIGGWTNSVTRQDTPSDAP